MGKVLKADASVSDAYVEIDLGSSPPEVWASFTVAFDDAALALWNAAVISPYFLAEWTAGHAGFIDGVWISGGGTGAWSWGAGAVGPPPDPTPGVCGTLLELHRASDASAEFYVDSVLVGSEPAFDAAFRFLRFGLGLDSGASADPASVVLITDVRIGTTRGAGDLFADDFSSGDLSAWTTTTGDVSVVDDPCAPPITPLLGDQPAASRLIVTDPDSATLTILDRRATGRQFLFTLDGPAYTTGQVASDDPEINIPYPNPTDPAFLTNNIRLIYWLRRETGATPPYVCRFGGIVMNLEDVAGDTPVSRYTAYDPWQYLMSRPIRDLDTGALPGPDGLKFPAGTLASDVAVGLLGQTELFDGPTFIDTSDGSLIEATDPIAGAFTLDAGLSVGEAWQQLVQTGTIDIVLIPVYDPLGLPGKVVKLRTAKFAGTVKHEAVMAWDLPSRSVTGISRMVDGTRLANQIQYYAGQGGTSVTLQTDAASLAAYGAYWAQQFFPGTANTALVELLALAELLIRRNGQRSLSFDPAPERSPLALRDYGLGDYLPVWASRNLREPIGIDYSNPDPSGAGYQRVYAIPIELTDDGVEHPRGLLTSRDASGAAA